jgi:hypothetical protein
MDQDKAEKESRDAELKEEKNQKKQSEGENTEKEKIAVKETKAVGPGE